MTMRRVFKYVLFAIIEDDDAGLEAAVVGTAIEVPAEAEIAGVGMQGRNVCLWALCDPEQSKRSRTFMVRGTGHSVPPDAAYVGLVRDGRYVWHVFESVS